MVVVLVAVLVLETLRSIPEIDLAADAGLAHQLDRSGHGGVSDAFVFFSDQIVQFLDRQMLLRGQKHLKHTISLLRMPQSFRGDKLRKFFSGIHLYFSQ